MTSTKFSSDYGKRLCKCQGCKKQIDKQELRLAKLAPNPFSESGGEMKSYFHPDCLFDAFKRARATTKVIETIGDIDGYADLTDDDKKLVRDKIADLGSYRANKPTSATVKKAKQTTLDDVVSPKKQNNDKPKSAIPLTEPVANIKPLPKIAGKADSWEDFGKLCSKIADVSGHKQKISILDKYIHNPLYDGDLHLLMKLLLPSVDQRVYSLGEKVLLRFYAKMFNTDSTDLEDTYASKGELSVVLADAFENSDSVKPAKNSTLTLQEVDSTLDKLANAQHDSNSQYSLLLNFTKKCTRSDLFWFIRELKSDLRINAGVKNIISALADGAYEAFQSCRSLNIVIDKVLKRKTINTPNAKKTLSVGITLGQPVLPMLAEPCKTVEFAFQRCSNGMFAEIKYDGERVQLHKLADNKFHFYSRSLKPVTDHKVKELKAHVHQAFGGTVTLIIDSEVLVVDTRTSKPLPFGTLGVHKKAQHQYAQECLFVFDLLMYDGQSLMDKPLSERKDLLKKHMKEVPNRVMFSDYEYIKYGETDRLRDMIDNAIAEGLEGLVMKDVNSVYEPGKRHWLKVKKDYLNDGAMADSADLLCLGAYYGTGNKGGQMSVFLLGCYDPKSNSFKTVTKCGNGFDDAELEKINKTLSSKVTRIYRDADRLPSWMKCARALTPDFIINDPHADAPVWEITGAEFSQSSIHTANGISIRFPRVTRQRPDKDYKTATNIDELTKLASTSRINTNLTSSNKRAADLANTSSSSSQSDPTLPTGGTGLLQHIMMGDFKHDNAAASDVIDAEPKAKKAKLDRPPVPVSKQMTITANMSNEKTEKPVCKYGAECYRKNKEHCNKFYHPEKETNIASTAQAGLISTDNNSTAPSTINTDKSTLFAFYIVYVHNTASTDQDKVRMLKELLKSCGCNNVIDDVKDIEPGAIVLCRNSSDAIADLTSKGVDSMIIESLSFISPKWVRDSIKNECIQELKQYLFSD